MPPGQPDQSRPPPGQHPARSAAASMLSVSTRCTLLKQTPESSSSMLDGAGQTRCSWDSIFIPASAPAVSSHPPRPWKAGYAGISTPATATR